MEVKSIALGSGSEDPCFGTTSEKGTQKLCVLHAETYTPPCRHRPASAAPFCRSYVSENPETSASTIPESIVSLRLHVAVTQQSLSTWPGNFQTCAWSEFQPVQQDTHSLNINMASEMEPEAMCFEATEMTSSKYRCAGHMLRVHVSAMCRHVLVLLSLLSI